MSRTHSIILFDDDETWAASGETLYLTDAECERVENGEKIRDFENYDMIRRLSKTMELLLLVTTLRCFKNCVIDCPLERKLERKAEKAIQEAIKETENVETSAVRENLAFFLDDGETWAASWQKLYLTEGEFKRLEEGEKMCDFENYDKICLISEKIEDLANLAFLRSKGCVVSCPWEESCKDAVKKAEEVDDDGDDRSAGMGGWLNDDPNATCYRCEKNLLGRKAEFCGGREGVCETLYCDLCWANRNEMCEDCENDSSYESSESEDDEREPSFDEKELARK